MNLRLFPEHFFFLLFLLNNLAICGADQRSLHSRPNFIQLIQKLDSAIGDGNEQESTEIAAEILKQIKKCFGKWGREHTLALSFNTKKKLESSSEMTEAVLNHFRKHQ